MKAFEALVSKGLIHGDTQYSEVHKLMSCNEVYNKEFYEQLHKADDGKEFLVTEITARIAIIKQ